MFCKITMSPRPTFFIVFTIILLFSPFCASAGTQFYPPENMEAGNGLLYFPKGGNSSVYAVPVQSQDLVDAIKELKDVITATSAWQCNWFAGDFSHPYYGCVNNVTGASCLVTNVAYGSKCPN